MLIKNRAIILFFSLSLSVMFFYLETVHEYFFKWYSRAINIVPIIEKQKTLSFLFVIYLLIVGVFLLYRRKSDINKVLRVYIYLLLPYLVSTIAWCFIDYSNNKTHHKMADRKIVTTSDLLILSYILHFVFIIPIISYPIDYILRMILFRKK